MKRRKGHALRKRYGRTLGPQAITRPAGGGMVNVILVDSKGRTLRTIAKSITRGAATRLIAEGS